MVTCYRSSMPLFALTSLRWKTETRLLSRCDHQNIRQYPPSLVRNDRLTPTYISTKRPTPSHPHPNTPTIPNGPNTLLTHRHSRVIPRYKNIPQHKRKTTLPNPKHEDLPRRPRNRHPTTRSRPKQRRPPSSRRGAVGRGRLRR